MLMDKKRWTTSLLLLLLMALPALAQGGGSREITGIVVDELGEPLIGAPDNPVITTGWGKIVDMTCLDAE